MSEAQQDTVVTGDRQQPVHRTADGAALYTLYPARSGDVQKPRTQGAALVLSRFAVVHREGERLVVESPRAWCDLVVQDPAVLTVVGAFAGPTTVDALPSVLPPVILDQLLDDLWEACLLVTAEGSEEDTEFRLRQWSPFELWTHTRSRLGAHGGFNASWGLTGWGEGLFPPLPAKPEEYPGAAIDLHRPDLDLLRDNDPSLTAVLEDRRSVRDHDTDRPITAGQLGEFLYRCARVRGTHLLDGIEHVDRPFPSGGALHELEVYALVRSAEGLEPGLYHYDGHAHRLRTVCEVNDATRQMVMGAELATGAEDPQVVLVIAARFGRLLWKYEGMGYAAVLKDVGVLYQVMYSVATAMGLAVCGIGGGHAEAFNQATGRDYFTEGVVGELLLGSRPQGTREEDPGSG